MQVEITRCDSFDLSNNASLLTIKEYFEQYKAGLNTVSELVHKVESVGYGVVSLLVCRSYGWIRGCVQQVVYVPT